MSVSRTICVLAALAAVASGRLTAQARQRFSMDPGWRFNLGDTPGAEQPSFDDRSWRRVDLPHDWSIEGTMRQDDPGGGQMGFYPGGIGWYRKSFRLPVPAAGRLCFIEFDGVYQNSDVWINGHLLGHRPYGYISFAYGIDRYLVPGINVIAVRVDNSRQPNTRWYSGSGIDRHTWLTMTDPLHIGHWGTYVTTPHADSVSADIVIRTRIQNRGAAARQGTLRSLIVDASGREVGRVETPFNAEADSATTLEQHATVSRPRLWSAGAPVLYTLRSEVVSGPRTVDTLATRFGIRSILWDKDRGFVLNGTRVKLKGVNLHQDAGGLGSAVPESIWWYRLALLKEAGVNAIRTSHNPPTPEFLDLCDSLGFLVMAEAFDEWTFGKVPHGYHEYFQDWSERDVTDFVQRDRNHPSIVLWSAGNEIGEQSSPGGADVLRRLVAIFHREDPTRPVTTGNDNIVADGHPATLDFLNSEDIVGYNYVDRWHERREIFADEDRHDHPEWKMVGTESGTIFQSFDERPSLGDSATPRPNYNYGMLQAERRWKWISTHDYFSGDFMWTGIDYLGEAVWPFRGFPSGMLDITAYPKDSWYFYRSIWTGQPVLHLFPHWNWPGREGQVIPVLAYSNCNRVELFLNGKSLGEKRLEFPAQGTSGGWNSYALPVVNPTTTDLHLSWDVPYEPGVVRAVGHHRDGTACATDEVRTAGAPRAIRAVAAQDTVTDGRGDVAQVRFEIVDSTGTVVPTADNLLRVSITDADVVVLDNADLRDQDLYRGDSRHVFNGRLLAIAHAAAPGTMRISASAQGLQGAEVTVQVKQGIAVASIPAAR